MHILVGNVGLYMPPVFTKCFLLPYRKHLILRKAATLHFNDGKALGRRLCLLADWFLSKQSAYLLIKSLIPSVIDANHAWAIRLVCRPYLYFLYPRLIAH